jgi:hypothetical protein
VSASPFLQVSSIYGPGTICRPLLMPSLRIISPNRARSGNITQIAPATLCVDRDI